jgi:hypothetical protein
MTAVETATKTLNDLLDQRDQLIGHSAKLVTDRQAIAYAAHAGGDKGAKERLRKINDETVLHNAELESIDAAIIEANARLVIAQADEAQQADRANAEQLRIKASRLSELASIADDCFQDLIGATNEMHSLLNEIHALGCPAPSHEQLRVFSVVAVKTHIMNIPGCAREFDHLAPNQRKTFENIVTGWRDMIEGNIAARLGEQPKAEEVAA